MKKVKSFSEFCAFFFSKYNAGYQKTRSLGLHQSFFRIGPAKGASAQPAQLGKMEVSYYTYMKFKGCEAKVVILLDVDDSDPRWSDRNGIYTAMSRAMHQLVILKKA